MKLFIYAKPNTMDGYLQNGECHTFTDDVALCYANSQEEAIGISANFIAKKRLKKQPRF